MGGLGIVIRAGIKLLTELAGLARDGLASRERAEAVELGQLRQEVELLRGTNSELRARLKQLEALLAHPPAPGGQL